MRGRIVTFAVAAAIALFAASGAHAERLVTALSHERVEIKSNFTGTQVVVFGTIERDAQTIARAGSYDVVVTVAGPPTNLVTRRKQRTLGVWINRANEQIRRVPSFLAIHSTRPLDEILGAPARSRLGLGLDMMPINAKAGPEPPQRTEFESAFLRLMQEDGHYIEVPNGVEFLGAELFRATITLPADVPVGDYVTTVQLFRDGALLATNTDPLHIGKIGFEQYVSEFAREQGLAYGLITVAIACLTGWLAGVIFRRD